MVKNEEALSEETELLRRAWPAGVPEAEAHTLRALPANRRDKVERRLKVLLDIEDARRGAPTAQVDMKARAAEAGVTVDGLFAIRRNWDAERSIRSIAPYLGRAERQATQRADDDPIVVAARGLLEGDGAARPDSAIAGDLRRQFGTSLPNMLRLVRRLRREEAADPERIVDAFGRALLVDVCAIDRVNVEGRSEPFAVAVVVERAAGLILGHAVASIDGDTIEAQRRAVEAALLRIGDEQLDVEGAPASVELTIGEGAAVDAAFSTAEFLRPHMDMRVNSRGPRRFGQRLVALLGKRMGRFWWRPRSTAPGSDAPASDARQGMSLADAAILVDVDCRDHDGRVVKDLAEAGIRPGWGVPDGAMASALRQVLSVLGG